MYIPVHLLICFVCVHVSFADWAEMVMLMEPLSPRREMTPSKMETPKGATPSPSPCAKVAGELVVAGAGHMIC